MVLPASSSRMEGRAEVGVEAGEVVFDLCSM